MLTTLSGRVTAAVLAGQTYDPGGSNAPGRQVVQELLNTVAFFCSALALAAFAVGAALWAIGGRMMHSVRRCGDGQDDHARRRGWGDPAGRRTRPSSPGRSAWAGKPERAIAMTTTVPRITHVRPPRRTKRRQSVAVLVVLGILAGVASASGWVAPRSATTRAPTARARRRGTSRATPAGDGLPGWPRTDAGAVAAATAYLMSLNTRGAVSDPTARAAVVRAIAVPEQRDALADQVRARRRRPTGPGDLFAAAFADERSSAWRMVPVGYRVDAYDDSSARISVWTVQVIAGVGSANVPATALWATTTLPLQWHEDTWKLDLANATGELGPAPGLGRLPLSSDLDVIAADQGFREYGHAR